MRSSPLLALLCSSALLGAACTSGASEESAEPAPSTTATPASTEDPNSSDADAASDGTDTSGAGGLSQTGGFIPAELEWEDCDGFECATLSVPLDYGDADGDRIDIAVRRSPTSSEERIGSVLLNPGGPGGSGLDYLPAAAVTLPSEVTSRFDLVSFDPRGVGASTAVDCDLDLDDQIEALDEGDIEGWNAALEEASVLDGEQCTGFEIAPFVGTNNAARDMDVLRQALGDEKLTYVGYSYGTRLGATYAELFPENVRALVLDAAVLPDSDLAKLDAGQAEGFDLAFSNFTTACDSDADCILQDIGPALEVYTGLQDELAEVGTLPVDGGRQLTAGELSYGVLAALYSVDTWPVLAEGLFVADTLGDGTILQFLADSLLGRQVDGTYSNVTEANTLINCADDPTRPTIDEARTAAFEAAAQSEYFGSIFRANTGCLTVSESIDPLVIGAAEGAPPILVIGNTGDPATPYAWSVALAESLDSGVLYTVEAEGHTAYGSLDCVESDVTAYLVDLTVPSASGCSENTEADFFPPSGESDLELLIGFFDCLIDEGLDVEPLTTASLLSDPSGESILDGLDLSSPDTAVAILACQSFLPELG